jgi:hypothetical protein
MGGLPACRLAPCPTHFASFAKWVGDFQSREGGFLGFPPMRLKDVALTGHGLLCLR